MRSSFDTTINVLDGLLEFERATGGSEQVRTARRSGEEYLLQRGLFRRKSTAAVVQLAYLEFAFPYYWHYDVLRALDYFRRSGADPDPRMAEAVAVVQSKRQAGQAGLGGRIRFETLDATSYPADGFDLICLLDTLHDLGDPAAALAHARKALAPDSAVLVVEPNAADDYAANLASPLAALSYAASTFQCTPAALAQPGGIALGAQAGPAAIRHLADDAGFSRFRQVAQTPVNVVLELRP